MTLPLDTSIEARDLQRQIYRRLGGSERVAIVFRLNALVRETAMAGIRRRHPSYTDAEVRAAFQRLTLGDDVMNKAFPDQELVEP
jgi:hypothetical protein